MDKDQFTQLLVSLRSEDNELRKGAEATYENVSTASPEWTMHALVEVCATDSTPGTVTIGLILLRKLFGSTIDCFDKADSGVQEAVKARLLQVFDRTAGSMQRKSAVACVSALAVKVAKLEQDWSALWESILVVMQSATAEAGLKAACCEVVATTTSTLTNLLVGRIQEIAGGLQCCLSGTDVETLKAAFAATSALASCSENAATVLSPLVPLLVAAIQRQLNVEGWDSAEELCSMLAECVENSPELFKGHTEGLLRAMMEVAAQPMVPKRTRHMALETMLSYCEGDAKTIRSIPSFMESLFALLFEYMLHPAAVEDAVWDNSNDTAEPEDLDGVTDQDAGCSGLDRMSMSLGGRKLQNVAQRLFSENITSPEWERRNAAVLLILYIGEGMHAALNTKLDSIARAVTALTSDSVKYVRVSALSCLGQLGNDFAPTLQEECHAVVVPALIASLRDSVPRVASVAADAVSEFFDNIGEEDDELDVVKDVEQYVLMLCDPLVTLLKTTPHTFVRESCLAALSSLTSTCKKALSTLTSSLMDTYQAILSRPDDAVTTREKCLTIECTTLLACGVGKELFGPYAHMVCSFLQGVLQGGLRSDDMRMRYILRGWTCMVECLEGDVLPYMDSVLPYLVTVMNTQCDTVIERAEVGDDGTEEDDGGDEDGTETVRLVIPGSGTVVAKYHTALIEDKGLASIVVLSILTILRGSIARHIPAMELAAVELLKFEASSDIRDSGAQILDVLVMSVAEVDKQEAGAVVQRVLPALLTAVTQESDMTAAVSMIKAIGQCVHAVEGLVPPQTVELIAEKIFGVMEKANERRGELFAERAAEADEDEADELEAKEELEKEVIGEVCDTVDVLLQRSGEAFAPHFVKWFLPLISQWLQQPRDEFDVTKSFAMLSEFAKCTPAHMLPHAAAIVSSTVSFATAMEYEDALQACFYCMNVMLTQLRLGGYADAVGFATSAGEALGKFLHGKSARQASYEDCTCNAVSAAVTILDVYVAVLQPVALTMLLDTVASFLPVGGDEIEARVVHKKVRSWVDQRHQVLALSPAAEQQIVSALQRCPPGLIDEVE